jgi:hypothetical protein
MLTVHKRDHLLAIQQGIPSLAKHVRSHTTWRVVVARNAPACQSRAQPCYNQQSLLRPSHAHRRRNS